MVCLICDTGGVIYLVILCILVHDVVDVVVLHDVVVHGCCNNVGWGL